MPGNPRTKRFRGPADAMDVIRPTSGDALGLVEDQAAAASDRGAAIATTLSADLPGVVVGCSWPLGQARSQRSGGRLELAATAG